MNRAVGAAHKTYGMARHKLSWFPASYDSLHPRSKVLTEVHVSHSVSDDLLAVLLGVIMDLVNLRTKRNAAQTVEGARGQHYLLWDHRAQYLF